jgi:membrane protein required for colicin V production
MNYLDIILALILLAGAIRGFTKGFVYELASLAGILLGIFAAAIFTTNLAAILSGFVAWSPGTIRLVSFIGLFLFVMLLSHIIGQLISGLIKVMGINILNRFAGIAAGVVKTALVLSILLILFNHYNTTTFLLSDETRNSSLLYNKISDLVPDLIPGFDFEDISQAISGVKSAAME